MALYLINTPVLTAYGDYRLEGPITVEQAQTILAHGYISAVGHEGTAALLSQILGLAVQTNRIDIAMQPCDRAVVLRVKQRLPEGMVFTAAQLRDFPFELSLLTRLA